VGGLGVEVLMLSYCGLGLLLFCTVTTAMEALVMVGGERPCREVKAELEDVLGASSVTVSTWCADGSGSGNSEHAVWEDFWNEFGKTMAQVLVLVDDGTSFSFYDSRSSEKKRYRISGETLALEIVERFMAGNKRPFQIVILIGRDTEQLGHLIYKKFRLMPVLVPPCVIGWTGNPELRDMLDFAGDFLKKTLSVCPDTGEIDLRATVHAFAMLKRGKNACTEMVRFFPQEPIMDIDRIYFHLGFCAYELLRRLRQVIKGTFGLKFLGPRVECGKREYGEISMCFLFGELFGWLYILRQQPSQLYHQTEIRDLEYSFSGEGVCKTPALPSPTLVNDKTFQLLKFHMRAIAEVMVERTGVSFTVLRYVDFCHKWKTDPLFRVPFKQLTHDGFPYLEDSESYDSEGVLLSPASTRLAWVHNELIRVVDKFSKELIEEEPISVRTTPLNPLALKSHKRLPKHSLYIATGAVLVATACLLIKRTL